MTSTDYTQTKGEGDPSLFNLSPYITKDGSLSIRDDYYNESFHSLTGARKEAEEKYINPAQINRFLDKKNLKILDVCVGLGYNSACLLEKIIETKDITLDWWGLEIDRRPLKIALKDLRFRESWSPNVLKILDSISISNTWNDRKSFGRIIWGDARKTIQGLPRSIKFDLIFHDAFSPSKCPQLWSEEFLKKLANKLSPGGRFITYSCSAAIRASLRRSGLVLSSTTPTNTKTNKWSLGTIATSLNFNDENIIGSSFSNALTKMEEEHLLTSAAIPYRDPTGESSALEILRKRAYEQQQSNLISTSSWKKRWEKAYSS